MNKNIRKDFPWLVKHPKLIYFDNAATTIKPKCVLDAITKFYTDFATNTHNSDSLIAYRTTAKVLAVRNKAAKIFNAKAQNIVFTSGCTEGLNMIAFGLAKHLKQNDEIILSKLEHASNILPWMVLAKQKKLRIKFLEDNKVPTVNAYLKAVTKRTKVIAVSGASNILGNQFDYVSLTKKVKAKRKDIIIVLDAAQTIPHAKINTACGIDFVACSAHKLLGPTGVGMVYMKDYWIKNLDPYKYGGGMNDSFTEHKFVLYNNVDKFEGGTLNLGGIFGLEAALDYLEKMGWKNIANYQKQLKQYFVKQLKTIKHLEVYSLDTELPIIFFNIKKTHAQDIASWLGTKGIICRAGLSCAKLSHNIIKTKAAVRFSLYFYNTKEEIDKVVKILKNYRKGDEIIL